MQTALDAGLEVLQILGIPLVKQPPENLIITEFENQPL